MKRILAVMLVVLLCVGYGGDKKKAEAAGNNEPWPGVQTDKEKDGKGKTKTLESQASKDLKKRGYTPGKMTGKDYRKIFGAGD